MSSQFVEIKDFTLFYDGVFRVSFEFENKKHVFHLILPPAKLIKILQENDLISSVEHLDFSDGVRITKSTLELRYRNGEFIMPDFLSEYEFEEDYE